MKRLNSLPTKVVQPEETSSLLSGDGQHRCTSRYVSTRKCVTSKAALLILVWCVIVSLAYFLVDHLHNFYNLPDTMGHISFMLISNGISIFLDYFYPLAGFLADVKLSRYKVVFGSVCCILVAILLILPGGGLLVAVFEVISGNISLEFRVLLVIIAIIIVCPAVALLFTGFVGFKANIIQFGLDQLYDYPGDDQVVFLHWQIWAFYLAKCMHMTVINFWIIYHDNEREAYILIGAMLVPIAVILMLTLYVAYHRKEWFLLQPSKVNPYRLVCRVTKFAWKHKVPIRRSAFTYCEDEVPTRLDLGKSKYGGPFTTEQVEDVKAFYGILKVLATFGSIFTLTIGKNSAVSLYYRHFTNSSGSNENVPQNQSHIYYTPVQVADRILLQDDLIASLLVVLCIPIHLYVIRPIFRYRIPGPLKRMGLGYLISLIIVLSLFALETATHVVDRSAYKCMFRVDATDRNGAGNSTNGNLSFLRYFVILENSLTALSNMLGYVALNEFICSQSPRSMTGLLIGLSFAVRGIFELGASFLVLPLSLPSHTLTFPSCGMIFYAVNVVVGMAGLAAFMSVARKYKYRERDEPCHVQRYVEEYYDNLLA